MPDNDSGVMLNVPEFVSANVLPKETTTGGTLTIEAEVQIVSKWFAAESLYSGEIDSGEV